MKKSRIQRQFDHGAAQYDVLGSLQQQILADLLQTAIAPSALAVDLGCGTGQGLAILAAAGHEQLVGIDIAPAMLTHARHRVPQAGVVLADIEAVPLPEACADLVVSSSALQWCDLKLALAEAVRITRPGGRLLISTFTRGTLSAWRSLWGIQDDGWFVTPTGIRDCLASLELQSFEIQTEVYRPRFRSFADAVASIRGLGAGATNQAGLMSPNRYRQIRRHVEAEIAQEGFFVLPYHVTRVFAVKRGSAINRYIPKVAICQQTSL
ncbi:malonyl-[acyl-carrier protein] O-methyltransferase [Arenicella chitinivorans]|uniref:Malonyl-[acyl-carrier protein] O-methyltransferase n=1 Tax=Arenicella chitinivorans TaxID=1329800 RepID=A0A918VL20_9GAMM|nr:methyltransferase domain-containing protein [Arenicella chitinivorans]GHA06124.1 malonyl-[acyl-carrier protein] O-methyltransferase [Arenicella chitinivorans]